LRGWATFAEARNERKREGAISTKGRKKRKRDHSSEAYRTKKRKYYITRKTSERRSVEHQPGVTLGGRATRRKGKPKGSRLIGHRQERQPQIQKGKRKVLRKKNSMKSEGESGEADN